MRLAEGELHTSKSLYPCYTAAFHYNAMGSEAIDSYGDPDVSNEVNLQIPLWVPHKFGGDDF